MCSEKGMCVDKYMEREREREESLEQVGGRVEEGGERWGRSEKTFEEEQEDGEEELSQRERERERWKVLEGFGQRVERSPTLNYTNTL